jgi:hypothetical protein
MQRNRVGEKKIFLMQTESRNIYVKSQQTTSAELTQINGCYTLRLANVFVCYKTKKKLNSVA